MMSSNTHPAPGAARAMDVRAARTENSMQSAHPGAGDSRGGGLRRCYRCLLVFLPLFAAGCGDPLYQAAITYRPEEPVQLPPVLKTIAVVAEIEQVEPQSQPANSKTVAPAEENQNAASDAERELLLWARQWQPQAHYSQGSPKSETESSDYSELAADLISRSLSEAIQREGLALKVVDREHLAQLLAEAKIQISDISRPGALAALSSKQVPVDALLFVRAESSTVTATWSQETHGVGDLVTSMATHGLVSSESNKQAIARNVAVRMNLRLTFIDGRVLRSQAAVSRAPQEKHKPGVVLGRDHTLADLRPLDTVVEELMSRQIDQFVGVLLGTDLPPERIEYKVPANEYCRAGAHQLGQGEYSFAEKSFQAAARNGGTSQGRIRFAIGLANEKAGKLNQAAKHYREALPYLTSADDEEMQSVCQAAMDRVANAIRNRWLVVDDGQPETVADTSNSSLREASGG